MELYRHTQRGGIWVTMIWVICALMIGWVMFSKEVKKEEIPLFLSLGVVFIGIGICFKSLTVKVNLDEVAVWFGLGWIKRRIPLKEVVSARTVRNPWWYGWGIRSIPGGWMFNINGLDAVELRLISGKIFRIGTDEPLRLMEALHQAGIKEET